MTAKVLPFGRAEPKRRKPRPPPSYRDVVKAFDKTRAKKFVPVKRTQKRPGDREIIRGKLVEVTE